MNSAKLALLVNKASPKLSLFAGRSGLHLKKKAPHILFGAGVVGVIASTVMACRATLKLSETLTEIERDIDYARGSDQAVTYAYARATKNLGRLYGPSLAVGVVSIGCLGGAHYNLTKRNNALMAAYAALATSFDAYRDRVRASVGDDSELDLYRGVVETRTNEDGEIEKIVDPNGGSPYARFFDEYSEHWVKNAGLNKLYLLCQQNYFNDLLRARGHLFLNEVYDRLGIERTPAGAVVGWLIGGDGDDYVDLNLNHENNIPFMIGDERSVHLDFNVDGVIYDKI